jgi:hypothetical protein
VAGVLDNNDNNDGNSSSRRQTCSASLPIPSGPDACAIPDGAAGCCGDDSDACHAECCSSSSGGKVYYLSSARYKVGLDAGRGGGICHLSLLTPQSSFQGRNFLNGYDTGRFVQQSYYGDEDGSDWNGRPWRWNPVQGGSWQNVPSRVLFAGGAHGGKQLSVATHPRNWAGGQLLDDCLMTTAVRFLKEDPFLVHVRQSFSYAASGKRHAPRTQETPAVFVDRRLGELCFYDGPEPWTNKPLRREKPKPQPPNSYYKTTERFAAYVNDKNVGLGVFCPAATGALTAYRVGPDGSEAHSDTSYFALTVDRAIVPGETLTYDCYLAAGTMPEIRAAFRRQAVRLGLAKAL